MEGGDDSSTLHDDSSTVGVEVGVDEEGCTRRGGRGGVDEGGGRGGVDEGDG